MRKLGSPIPRGECLGSCVIYPAKPGNLSTPIEELLGYRRGMTFPAQPYATDMAPAAAPPAARIAAPASAAILRGLLPGRPLAAGELARTAGVSAATASFHLG